MSVTNVGVIGLGALGEPTATRLLARGFRVAVHDVRDEPMARMRSLGATACANASEVAKRSELVISLVADAAQTCEVVSGLLDDLSPGSVVAIGSTVGVGVVRGVAARLEAKGAHTLDMPISGGLVAARDGTLSLMVGAADTVLERVMPVLRTFARSITHTGEVGTGQAAKLAHQLVFGVNVMALLEGLALGAAGGVKPDVLKQVFSEGLANSKVLDAWPDLGARWKGMLEASSPGATLPNLRKDLHLVLELAREVGINPYIVSHASLIADAGVANGHADPRL